MRPQRRVDLTLCVDYPARGDIWSAWACHMAPKPKLTAPCGVQALATSSGVAPKVENREFYFDNIPMQILIKSDVSDVQA